MLQAHTSSPRCPFQLLGPARVAWQQQQLRGHFVITVAISAACCTLPAACAALATITRTAV